MGKGGLPKEAKDGLFQKRERKDDKSQSKQSGKVDKSESVTRQTYYIPKDLHRELKVRAALEDRPISELVVEALRLVLKG